MRDDIPKNPQRVYAVENILQIHRVIEHSSDCLYCTSTDGDSQKKARNDECLNAFG